MTETIPEHLTTSTHVIRAGLHHVVETNTRTGYERILGEANRSSDGHWIVTYYAGPDNIVVRRTDGTYAVTPDGYRLDSAHRYLSDAARTLHAHVLDIDNNRR